MPVESRLASLQLDYTPTTFNSVSSRVSNYPAKNITLASLSASTLKEDSNAVSSKLMKGNNLTDPYALFSAKKKTNASTQTTVTTFDQIRNGNKVLEKGDKGESVKQLQNKLTDFGFPVPATGYFGSITESSLKSFQRSKGITPTGKLGPTTMKAMDGLLKPAITKTTPITKAPTKAALRLANSAKVVAARRSTYGWCYSGVATAVDKVFGGILYGRSAYMAAPILAKNPKFQEIKVPPQQLPKLQPGAIVVWGKTNVSPNGHISVALGNGKEASDHITNQLTALRGHQNFRVFVPMA